jgi:outer membrane lipoprotein-sorting protein
MRYAKQLIALALMAAIATPMVAIAQEKTIEKKVDINALSKKLDELYRSESSKAVMTMQIVTPNYERTLEMEMTTKGTENTLIRILSPRKEKGISTLKRGNEMWNYLPKVKKVVRVPPSMMMSSWMGSDVTNDDLVRDSSWDEDYTVKQVPAKAGEFCFDYTPKESAAVTWSRVHTCFDAKLELPKLQEFYDEKGRKVRQMNFDRYRKVDGRVIPTRISVIPLSEDKKGNKTVMTYKAMSFDVEVPDETFSMANLRRGK